MPRKPCNILGRSSDSGVSRLHETGNQVKVDALITAMSVVLISVRNQRLLFIAQFV